jgi:hypothetical protein
MPKASFQDFSTHSTRIRVLCHGKSRQRGKMIPIQPSSRKSWRLPEQDNARLPGDRARGSCAFIASPFVCKGSNVYREPFSCGRIFVAITSSCLRSGTMSPRTKTRMPVSKSVAILSAHALAEPTIMWLSTCRGALP